MTRKTEENKSNQSPDNSISDTHENPIGEDVSNSRDTEPTANKGTSHKHTEQHHTIVVNVPQPNIDRTDIIESNRASWWSVKVNAGLLLCTVTLAIISIWQGCLTRKSVTIAESVFKADTAYNSKNFETQEEALDSQKSAKKQSDIADAKKTKRDTDFINKQKQGIDSQISAIKATQKQFEISHSPYITVMGFGRNPADSLEIDIINQGTQVAYLVEFDYTVKAERGDGIFKKYKTTAEWNKWLTIPKNPYNAQSIMGPGNGVKMFKTLKSVSDTDMNFVMQRRKSLIIRIAIYYFNTTTNKYMRYDYVAGWNPVDNLVGSVFFNYAVIKKYPE